jgi:hypothetical protein
LEENSGNFFYTTFDKKVMVAEKEKKWFISDWDEEIEIIDGVMFNLESKFKKEGVN